MCVYLSNLFQVLDGYPARTGLHRILQFWELAFRLKREPRQGWSHAAGIQRVESVADHSFALALLALFEGERRGLDVGRLLKLALIHDLEEAITGDLTPRSKNRLGAERVDRARWRARNKILSQFPARSRASYRRLWMDLNEGHTREARLVHELDKVEMALQADKYSRYLTERSLDGFFLSARSAVKDPSLRAVLEVVAGKRLR